MNKKALVAVLGITAAALAAPAAAQNLSAAYIGGSLGQSKFKIDCGGGLTCDDKDTAFRIFGGYQFTPNLSAELGYADLGKAKLTGPGGSDQLGATAWDLSGVFQWPFPGTGFSLFGRLGLFMGEMELSGVDRGNKTSSGLTLGFGGGYNFNRNIGVRAEWQRYSKMKARNDATGVEDEGDVDALSIGVLYRFQ
jgi:OOP family OmpA-OmpF porin